MATLTGQTVQNSYKDLLQVSNANAGIDGVLRAVEDGEGTVGPLQLSTTVCNITGTFQIGGVASGAFTSADSTKLGGIAAGATANSTDIILLDRANHTGTQLAATVSDFNTAADSRITAQKGAVNGLATLDAGGLVPSIQMPPIALTTVQVAANQVALLALTTQEGDVVIQSDISKSFVRNAGLTGTISDFNELLAPGAVISVNSQTGVVSLTTDNITEGAAQYFTNTRAITGVQGAATLALTGTLTAGKITEFVKGIDILGTLVVLLETGISNSPIGFTIKSARAQSSTGTATVVMKIDGVAVTGGTLSVSTVSSSVTPTALNVVAVGQDVQFDVTAIAAGADVTVWLEIERAL